MDLEQLRYPVGRFTEVVPFTAAGRAAAIEQLAALPAQVRAAVAGLADAQLDTPYRPDGWTVRQVVHHLADSHMNAFIRLKLALTEENPTIKPYDENAWADAARRAAAGRLLARHPRRRPRALGRHLLGP